MSVDSTLVPSPALVSLDSLRGPGYKRVGRGPTESDRSAPPVNLGAACPAIKYPQA